MPLYRTGRWSQYEDDRLAYLTHTQGTRNWVLISSELGARSPKQCRERYQQHLKPGLRHHPFSPEEGAFIERMVREIGKRWSKIATFLEGRSDNAIKNWYNSGSNRRRRRARNLLQDQCAGFQREPAQHPSMSPPASQHHIEKLPPLTGHHALPTNNMSSMHCINDYTNAMNNQYMLPSRDFFLDDSRWPAAGMHAPRPSSSHSSAEEIPPYVRPSAPAPAVHPPFAPIVPSNGWSIEQERQRPWSSPVGIDHQPFPLRDTSLLGSSSVYPQSGALMYGKQQHQDGLVRPFVHRHSLSEYRMQPQPAWVR